MRFPASLTDIACFVAVFEERSITAAAAREHATQSGVSQHIRKLEKSLGVELFTRDASRLLPTPAAEPYYRSCVELLRQYELAQRDVQQYGDDLQGEVSVGLMATVTRSVLAPTLVKFTGRHPNVRIRVLEAQSRILAQQVHAGDLDLAVVPSLLEHTGLKRTFFLRTPEVLVSSPDSGLVHRQPVELARLAGLKLILPGQRNIRRQAFDRYFADAGVRIAREMELDVVLTVLDIVEKSDWRALLPGVMMAQEIRAGRLTINRLVNPSLWFDFSCIEPLRRPMTRSAQAFLQALQEEATQLNAESIALLHPGDPGEP
jgi:LysR family nitrogen assimilation transcriptional regulator